MNLKIKTFVEGKKNHLDVVYFKNQGYIETLWGTLSIENLNVISICK